MIYTIPHVLRKSVVNFPDKEAFRFMDQAIVYRELDHKSDQLAKQLLELGVKKGDRVGIYMNRCLETCIAVYGVLKSGAAYVPLDPFSPVSRTLFLVEDCGINILISSEKQKKKVARLMNGGLPISSIIGIGNGSATNYVSWDSVFSKSLEDYTAANVLEQDLAYILYTSGSTGTPKGIMHTHYSGLNFAKLVIDLYRFDFRDKIAITAPLHFDPSTLGYFSGPLVGATTVIISDAHLKMTMSLAELMQKEELTVWFSVPLILIQLLQSSALEGKDFSSLRWVLFSGEVFTTKHLKSLMRLWPGKKFGNIYGPTEVNQCTYYNLDHPPESDDPIPIGRVWGNTEFKILDGNDNEVVLGNAGELVVRTGTMMKGYWNNQALTNASLYKEKIAPGMEHVFYRTGDQVKLDANKQLLFLGRNDRQVKFRGYRIEIDEIEHALLKHEGVEEAVVILYENVLGEKELGAAVLITQNSIVELSSLTTFCKSLLPSYAVPEKIIVMDELPRTGTGKINRNEVMRVMAKS